MDRRPCIECGGENIQPMIEITQKIDGSKHQRFCLRCTSCDNTSDLWINFDSAKIGWDRDNTPSYGNIIVEDVLRN